MKKLLLLLAVLCCTVGNRAVAQTVTPNKNPWAGKTYTWTDDDGVTHTANLTDKAEDPNQMMALLGAVYCDPEVPGQLQHNEYTQDGKPCKYQLWERNINYDDHGRVTYTYSNPAGNTATTIQNNLSTYFSEDGVKWTTARTRGSYAPWVKLPAGVTKIPQPNEDGMTVILVEVKDSWDQSHYRSAEEKAVDPRPFMAKAYKSMQLMTQWMRVEDDDNPGYIFNIDEVTTSRFFFLSKGRTRRHDGRLGPMYVAFEIVAPKDTKISAENLNNGKIERVAHDCYSVFQNGSTVDPHYVDLDNNEASSLSNLTLFMPDKRFPGVTVDLENKTFVNTSGWGGWVGNPEFGYQKDAGERFQPGVLLYKAFLNAKAEPTEGEKGYYNITLDWSTWFDAAKLRTTVNELFYVYIYDEKAKDWVLLHTIDAAKEIGEYTFDKTFTYKWKQTEDAQTFTYIVRANPIESNDPDAGIVASSINVRTNTASVIIPGTKEEFINDVSDYRSRFALDTEGVEFNVYRNRPLLTLISKVASGHDYSVHRTASTGEDVVIATIKFEDTDGVDTYNYTVTYADDTQNLDLLFDSGTSKELTATGTVEIGGSIQLIDRFTASTEKNDHPSNYTYQLKLDAIDKSNAYEVPVHKSTCDALLAGFTLDDVAGDTNHQLREEKEVRVKFAADIDRERTIEKFNVHRVKTDAYDDAYEARIGKAMRTDDNRLAVIGINHETGHLTNDFGVFEQNATGDNFLTLYDDSDYVPDLNLNYVTEIFSGTRDYSGVHVTNTYGTSISRIAPPQLLFTCTQKTRSDAYDLARDPDNKHMGYSAQLELTPEVESSNVKTIYGYRVWRVKEDGTEVLLNTITGGEAVEKYYASYDQLQAQWPDNTLKIYVTDVFDDLAIPVSWTETFVDELTGETHTEIEGGTKEVTYIARMYTTTAPYPTSPTPAPGRQGISPTGIDPEIDADHIYYVTEKEIVVEFDYTSQTVTSVRELPLEADVVNTVYYNLLGTPSSHPWQGVNVVVRLKSDGSRTTVKQLF